MKLLTLFLSALLLSGCADPLHPRELQTLQPVQTVGFDAENGEITVSVSDRELDGDEGPLRLAAAGESVVRAVENLQSFAPREELFFAHARYAVVGEAAARTALPEVLDWFSRSTQTRLRLPLFVVRGGTARALATLSQDDGYELTALLTSLTEARKRRGEPEWATVLEVLRSLSRYGAALCPALEIAQVGINAPQAEGALLPIPVGCAVLKDGALCGYLTPAQARGAAMLRNKAGAVTYALDGGTVTLRRCTAQVEPEQHRIRVRVTAALTALTEPGELTEERRASLAAALGETVAGECAAALEAAERLKADLLGLGEGYRGPWEVAVSAALVQSHDTAGSPPLRGEGGADGKS